MKAETGSVLPLCGWQEAAATLQRMLEALPMKVDAGMLAGKIGGLEDDLQDATWTSSSVWSIRMLFFSRCQS